MDGLIQVLWAMSSILLDTIHNYITTGNYLNKVNFKSVRTL